MPVRAATRGWRSVDLDRRRPTYNYRRAGYANRDDGDFAYHIVPEMPLVNDFAPMAMPRARVGMALTPSRIALPALAVV